jgi:hypothetical protein
MRKSSVLAIQSLSYHSEGTCDGLLFLFGPFSLVNLGSRFLLRGVDCGTPSVTIAAPVTLRILTLFEYENSNLF